jgi:putative spermidine/putrescine transport system substrate-binding protein
LRHGKNRSSQILVTFGMKAKAQDALEPYKPANWDQVAPGLMDADGYWTTIHSGA